MDDSDVILKGLEQSYYYEGYGNEHICAVFQGSKQDILSSYGDMDAFVEYMRDYEHDLTPYMSGDGVYRAPFKYSYDTYGGTTGLDNQVVGFVTSDGFEITGVHRNKRIHHYTT